MGLRAAVVVTGTEVLTGRVTDANGPWLAERLQDNGIDISQIVIVGDRAEDLANVLRPLCADHDLVITSGGLGPTADDLTAAVVADVQQRPLALDSALEQRITAIVAGWARARGRRGDPAALAAGVRKQALVPGGAQVLEPTGTAPGLVVPPPDGMPGAPVVVLPGPPSELRAMWPAVLSTPAVQQILAASHPLVESEMRLYGVLEADLAATLRAHAADLDGLEISTCLRDGELEIVTRSSADAQPAVDRLRGILGDTFGPALYSPTGETIDQLVARRLLDLRATISTAESCTAGLVSGRLADLPGSSAYLLGGLVAYANSAKRALLGVPADLLETHGAVSAPVAHAMARGAKDHFGTTFAVSTTGIAGPAGGTVDKPVGLVHLCAVGDSGILERRVVLPGDRAQVRRLTTTVALHLVRQLIA
ncbi:MAG: competence/damage-inducible protein A [Phycicoccus sp.]|nr:competence/damage-inducible protein A [Phycicoccus sp.]